MSELTNPIRVNAEYAYLQAIAPNGCLIETIIDKDDAESVSCHYWTAVWHPRSCHWVISAMLRKSSEYALLSISRFIMGSPKGLVVDHINGDALDNRRQNLRVVTVGQNTQNSPKPHRGSNTGFRGVCWDKALSKYRAYVQSDGKKRHLGLFNTAEEANEAAIAGRQRFQSHCAENSRP